jgi:putative hemolysin
MGSWIELAILIALQALLSAARTSIVNVRKTRLRQLQEDGNRVAGLVERLAEDSTRFIATAEVAATFINLLAATVAGFAFAPAVAGWLRGVSWLAPAAGWLAVLLVILALGLVLLTFGHTLPSLLALHYAEPVALAAARPMQALGVLVWPAARLVTGVASALAGRPASGPEPGLSVITEEEIKTMVDAGEEGGVIEEDEKEMIYSIFQLGETMVREVMVPRIDIVAVEAGAPMLEALDAMLAAGHSRIPIYRDTIDNIIGILHIKDLVPYLRRGETTVALDSVVRQPYFVPETKKVDSLLPEMQSRKVHMAVVVDEYGGTAGLVTIEDLLEEIVGEIQDEYDSEEPLYEQAGENEYVLNARINLDDLAELLETEFPDEESDTLGGFIYKQLGRVPAAGDVVDYGNLHLTVLSVDGRRIDKVRLTRERVNAGSAAAEEQSPAAGAEEEHE